MISEYFYFVSLFFSLLFIYLLFIVERYIKNFLELKKIRKKTFSSMTADEYYKYSKHSKSKNNLFMKKIK